MKAIRRLAFLASHRGSNMQAILDACKAGSIRAQPVLVLSNNKNSGALERARQGGIDAVHLSRKVAGSEEALDARMCEALVAREVDLVVLAGFMQKIGPRVLAKFRRRIVNIHPSLLPAHGGQGMYGMNVHKAVLAAGEKQTGVSVHLVDEEYDTGPILAQVSVPVIPGDTPESLAARVLAVEHQLYPTTISRLVNGEIDLEGLAADHD